MIQDHAEAPWAIKWSPEQQQVMNRNFGLHFTRLHQFKTAALYYDKSLQLKSDDIKALHFRSKCKRNIAQTEAAFKDSLAAKAVNDNQSKVNVEYCDTLYELNKFEECLIDLHDQSKRFKGNEVQSFLTRVKLVETNLEDCNGEAWRPFILKNQKILDGVLADIESKINPDKRPLWKIQREQGKCDLQSVLDKKEILLSPLEIARRHLSYRIFTQIYLNEGWVDFVFLRDLCDNSQLLLKKFMQSTPKLKEFTNGQYELIKKFLKMLHVRDPQYNAKRQKNPNPKRTKENIENNLYRKQYQVHRNMHIILKTLKEMRLRGHIEKLSRYVEEVMGDYVVLKTHRTMPWKFEFLNEVYNILALAHTDLLTIPKNLKRTKDSSVLMQLFRMGKIRTDTETQFIFGDRSTYQDAGAADNEKINYLKFLTRMEKRLVFVKYDIEKCYLLFEIARSHMKQRNYDKCNAVAQRSCEEAKKCNSMVWQFLSLILICKSASVYRKIEQCKEVLAEAEIVCKQLKRPQLLEFVKVCIDANDWDIELKLSNRSAESLRNRSKSSSVRSRSANVSFNDSPIDES